MKGALDFSDGKTIVGKWTSPKAEVHYNWLKSITEPNYNRISENNTVIPDWGEFWKNVHIEMNDKNCPRSHGAYFRMAYEMAKLLYVDAFERIEVRAKDKKANAKTKTKTEVDNNTDLQTQVSMLTDLVAQLIDNQTK